MPPGTAVAHDRAPSRRTATDEPDVLPLRVLGQHGQGLVRVVGQVGLGRGRQHRALHRRARRRSTPSRPRDARPAAPRASACSGSSSCSSAVSRVGRLRPRGTAARPGLARQQLAGRHQGEQARRLVPARGRHVLLDLAHEARAAATSMTDIVTYLSRPRPEHSVDARYVVRVSFDLPPDPDDPTVRLARRAAPPRAGAVRCCSRWSRWRDRDRLLGLHRALHRPALVPLGRLLDGVFTNRAEDPAPAVRRLRRPDGAPAVASNCWLAYRTRPAFRGLSAEQQGLDRYRVAIDPYRRVLVIAVAALLGLIAGASAASEWRTWLLRSATPSRSAPRTRSSAWTCRSSRSGCRSGASCIGFGFGVVVRVAGRGAARPLPVRRPAAADARGEDHPGRARAHRRAARPVRRC